MVKQYPHYLFVVGTAETSRDENGNYTIGEEAKTFTCFCREEPENKGQQLQAADGTFNIITSVIYIPLSHRQEIPAGTKIIVSEDKEANNVRITGQVLRCYRGQLNMRLWL